MHIFSNLIVTHYHQIFNMNCTNLAHFLKLFTVGKVEEDLLYIASILTITLKHYSCIALHQYSTQSSIICI